MKKSSLKQNLLAGLAFGSLLAGGSLRADTTVFFAGGNASQSILYDRVTNILSGGINQVFISPTNSTVRTYIGTIASQPGLGNVTIHFSLLGAVGGFQDVAGQNSEVTATTNTLVPTVAVSSTSPEAVGINPAPFTQVKSLVVPFVFIKNTNLSPKGIAIIVATLGKSSLVDNLVKAGTINAGAIAGKWESFVITTVEHPFPGVDQALVIAGSDKRGTIYGLYEISEQIGVSPWYWWADVPVKHHDNLFIKAGTYVQGPPVVKYRVIFINDEEPCFGPWAREKFGGINSKMYSHMFELLLRLRANFLWPAMWGKAFNEDDPLNPRVADEYGIVMGTSHHEPMIRAQQEWTKSHSQFGNGEWNYLANEEGLKKFWTEGIERNKNYESVVTVGMRGDGDLAMPDAGGLEANKKLLEKIIADQRQILAEHLSPEVPKIPQLWALFTEVQQYYDAGLKLPDDVTLLFCDDNVGDLRRLPTPEERKRSGGAGIYFHMDMHGGPFSYQWLNSSPLPKVQEQMNLACEYGATRIWLANVGDLKPLEIPLEFFIRMGWNPAAMTKDVVADYQRRWAEREFGREHAD